MKKVVLWYIVGIISLLILSAIFFNSTVGFLSFVYIITLTPIWILILFMLILFGILKKIFSVDKVIPEDIVRSKEHIYDKPISSGLVYFFYSLSAVCVLVTTLPLFLSLLLDFLRSYNNLLNPYIASPYYINFSDNVGLFSMISLVPFLGLCVSYFCGKNKKVFSLNYYLFFIVFDLAFIFLYYVILPFHVGFVDINFG